MISSSTQSHFIVKCKDCGTMISQCRCPSQDKAVRYDLCSECKILVYKKTDKEEQK